jgi:hypothetical protein
MSENPRERDIARRFGFARPRPLFPGIPEADGVQPARSVIDRLGVRPGMRVALVGVDDPDLPRLVGERTQKTTTMAPHSAVDMVIYQAEGTFALQRLSELSRSVSDSGALWVLWPRGQEHIRQTHVQRAGSAAGLVDIKMASVTDRLSGLKFIHRRANR